MSPTTMIQQSFVPTKSILPPPPPLKDLGGGVTVFKESNPGQYIKVSQNGENA